MTTFRYFSDPHGSSASRWQDLAARRLAERGLTSNEGDVAALAGDADLVEARRIELEERPPGLVTWQGLVWPAHCGDWDFS